MTICLNLGYAVTFIHTIFFRTNIKIKLKKGYKIYNINLKKIYLQVYLILFYKWYKIVSILRVNILVRYRENCASMYVMV